MTYGKKQIRNKEGNVACMVGRWEGSRAVIVSIKKGHCLTHIIVYPNLEVEIKNSFAHSTTNCP